jgi:CBS domain containing-hemolysin-like protein
MVILASLGKLAAVLALVLLNGFFVAAEFAIVKVRATQIEPLVKRGQRRARVAEHVITHLDTYLSATQLGITLTSLGLGWMGEPFMSTIIEDVLLWLGLSPSTLLDTFAAVAGFSCLTFLLIVLGELGPRWLAIRNAQRTTLLLSPPLRLFERVFRPVIWILNVSSGVVLRGLGITPVSDGEIAHTEEEMRLLLSRGLAISSLGRSISLNAIELRNRTVREVMVPRTSVVYLSTGASVEHNIALALENQFTRYPLCETNLDNVSGMIHLKDLFRIKGDQGPGTKLLEIKREMLFVPETMPLERILNTFLAKRVLMAIAVDEYGGTAGLVTLENVLEELVGEIRDEFDVEPMMVQKVSEAEYLVDGGMALHDFSRMFDVAPDTKDVVTVSGFAIQLLGRVPERGATLTFGGWSGTVDAVDKRKVKTLRLKKLPTVDHEA